MSTILHKLYLESSKLVNKGGSKILKISVNVVYGCPKDMNRVILCFEVAEKSLASCHYCSISCR